MKKKKISSQQIKFIINLFSIAIFAVSYLYIYTGYVEKTEAAYNKVKVQKQYKETLEEKIAQEATVEQKVEELNAQINSLIDQYPVKIAKADGHMYVEQIQKDLGITFSSIDVKESVPFFTTILPIRNGDGTEVIQGVQASNKSSQTQEINQAANNSNTSDNNSISVDELTEVENAISDNTTTNTSPRTGTEGNTAQTMLGTKTTILMNFTATYEEFKEFVDYIAEKEKKAVIDSVSVSVDSMTGKLTGNLVLVFFALEGTGKVYEAPMIEDISIGTDNIFGISNQNSVQENENTQADDTIEDGSRAD